MSGRHAKSTLPTLDTAPPELRDRPDCTRPTQKLVRPCKELPQLATSWIPPVAEGANVAVPGATGKVRHTHKPESETLTPAPVGNYFPTRTDCCSLLQDWPYEHARSSRDLGRSELHRRIRSDKSSNARATAAAIPRYTGQSHRRKSGFDPGRAARTSAALHRVPYGYSPGLASHTS
jgi:hypothetical protein